MTVHPNNVDYVWVYVDLYNKNNVRISTKTLYQGYINAGSEYSWNSYSV